MTAVLIALLVIAAILSVASEIVSYAVHSEEDAEGDAYWDDDDENRNAPTGLIDDNDTAPVTGSIPSASAAVATLIQMNTSKSFAIMNNTELVIGKGSLFLGRLTNLFDGVSFVIEANPGKEEAAPAVRSSVRANPVTAD